MADLKLRDIAVETGDVFWPAEKGGDVAILGWNTHDAASINLKNPTKDETFTYEVADVHMGWFDLGGWKEVFNPKTFQLDPGAETKITVSEGVGKSVINKGWKKAENVGGNTPNAPPPFQTDLENAWATAQAYAFWIILAVVAVVLIAFVGLYAAGGGQGVAALKGAFA